MLPRIDQGNALFNLIKGMFCGLGIFETIPFIADGRFECWQRAAEAGDR